jgi:hypothetical protein
VFIWTTVVTRRHFKTSKIMINGQRKNDCHSFFFLVISWKVLIFLNAILMIFSARKWINKSINCMNCLRVSVSINCMNCLGVSILTRSHIKFQNPWTSILFECIIIIVVKYKNPKSIIMFSWFLIFNLLTVTLIHIKCIQIKFTTHEI